MPAYTLPVNTGLQRSLDSLVLLERRRKPRGIIRATLYDGSGVTVRPRAAPRRSVGNFGQCRPRTKVTLAHRRRAEPWT